MAVPVAFSPNTRHFPRMTTRLATALADAAQRLDSAGQERLAALVEATVADWTDPSPFTTAELDHLREIDAEPFEAADAEAVRAFFVRHAD